jgi:hypothetical protein
MERSTCRLVPRGCAAVVVSCALTLIAATVTRAAVAPEVTINVGAALRSMPSDFFGLSCETNEMPHFESAGVAFDRMIALIRPANGAPLPVRVGGRSADETYWRASARGAGPWISELNQAWPDGLARIVRADNLRIQLNVNLAVHSPAMAVQFVSDVERRLPPGTLAGLAVGNEPDLYRLQSWLDRERVSTTTPGTPQSWTARYDSARYVSDFRSYAAALTQRFPRVRLLGPELSYPSVGWPTDLLNLRRFAPVSLTFHRYATAACTPDQDRRLPTAAGFLDDHYSGGLAATLAGDLQFARAYGLAIRVSEMNTVACGGPASLVQSFATALWAPDALFEMARAGIVSVNWHIRAATTNAPAVFGAHGISARPELYGLALFARMIGPGAELLSVRLDPSSGPSLKAWAVRSRGHVRILVINRSGQQASLQIARPPGVSGASGSLIRLLAPSVAATQGVTLAGQTIGADGRWHGRVVVETVHDRGGSYSLPIGGYSAALLDLS